MGSIQFTRDTSTFLQYPGEKNWNINSSGALTIVADVKFTGNVPGRNERIVDMGNALYRYLDSIVLSRWEKSSRLYFAITNKVRLHMLSFPQKPYHAHRRELADLTGLDATGHVTDSIELALAQAVEVCQIWSENGTIVQDEWMTIMAEYHATTNSLSLTKNGRLIAGPTQCTEAPGDRSINISFLGKSRFYHDDYFNGEMREIFVADQPVVNLTRVCRNETEVGNITLVSLMTCLTSQSSTWTPDVGLQYYRDQNLRAAKGIEGESALAVDENAETCSQTWRETSPWWRLDFEAPRLVISLRIYYRTDVDGGELDGFNVHVGGSVRSWDDNPPCAMNVNITQGNLSAAPDATSRVGMGWVDVLCQAEGRYLYVVLPGINRSLALCEVLVNGLSNARSNAIAGILPNCTACLSGELCCCLRYVFGFGRA